MNGCGGLGRGGIADTSVGPDNKVKVAVGCDGQAYDYIQLQRIMILPLWCVDSFIFTRKIPKLCAISQQSN